MDEPHKAYPLAHGHPRHNRHSKPKPSPLLPVLNCFNGLLWSDPPFKAFCYRSQILTPPVNLSVVFQHTCS